MYNVTEVMNMYISVKALRIIAALLFAVIVYINVSVSNNKNIPEEVNRKISNISVVIVIVMVALGYFFGIFNME